MKFNCLFLLAILPVSLLAAEYEGRVGKWEANFSIDFHADGTVSGVYSYPRRPGVSYRLKGENREEGKLNLNEFTGKNLSARCVLTKKVSESRIVWEGLMYNTDGRDPFEMSFSRPRDKKENSLGSPDSSPAVVTVPAYWPFSPTRMNAHISGKVRFGSFGGEAAWCAFVLKGEEAELQFSGARTGWKKRILNGTNPETGLLQMSEGGSSEWEFRKTLTPDLIEWRGVDPESGENLVFSRRRENDYLNDDYRVVPESCRWMYTSDRDQQVFYQAKLGRFPIAWEQMVVKKIKEENSRVSEVVLARAGMEDAVFRFQPPRPLNRVPVVEGITVRARIDPQGHNSMMWTTMGPHAYRTDSRGMWELLMSPAKGGSVGKNAPRIVVRPDFFDPGSPAPEVGWWIEADIIEWNEEAAGPGALELESIDLNLVNPENEDSRRIEAGPVEPRVDQNWKEIPGWEWFFREYRDSDGPRKTIPLQMRVWSAG